MRILITGITGFVGSHLAEFALARGGIQVFGTSRWRSRMENLTPEVRGRVHLIECDLRDAGSVDRALEVARPDRIFHLAAQSFVPASWSSPADTLTSNVLGEVNIFESMRRRKSRARIVIAGSSEEYGLVHPAETPIKETNPLRPLSPYAVSKIAQDMLAYQYFRSYGLHAIRTRAFNHTGPRRGEVFVTSNFAKQVAEIEAGLRPPVLMVGNLSARRDFVDVRDVVRAYWLILDKGEPGELYNVATGTAWSIQQVVDMLRKLSRVKIRTQVDPSRLRPSDVELLVGDSTKLRKRTGWKPTIPFPKTLSDLLDYWRQRISAAPGHFAVSHRH